MIVIFVLCTAYLCGSLPTALLVSHLMAGVDIREVGDGNMGARNTTHVLGWRAGIIVAVVDFSKGALAVGLARSFNLSLEVQLAAGACAVLGHDFPIFARFRGGQGMAVTLGALFVLMPVETSIGLMSFGVSYLFMRSFDPSAAVGLGMVAFLVYVRNESGLLLGTTVLLFLSIPAKKAVDWPRRRRLEKQTLTHNSMKEVNGSER
jgi:glycerol-3-phosphate acyltransferase PlsY